MVLDADALTLLAEKPRHRDDWILTPHPGEAARLLGTDSRRDPARPAGFGAGDRRALRRRLRAEGRGHAGRDGGPRALGLRSRQSRHGDGRYRRRADRRHRGARRWRRAISSRQRWPACCCMRSPGDRAARAGERGLIASDLIARVAGRREPAMELMLPDDAATQRLGAALARKPAGPHEPTACCSPCRANSAAARPRSRAACCARSVSRARSAARRSRWWSRTKPARGTIHHLDLYRLQGRRAGTRRRSATATLRGVPGLVIVEWPERGGTALGTADLSHSLHRTLAGRPDLRASPQGRAGQACVAGCFKIRAYLAEMLELMACVARVTARFARREVDMRSMHWINTSVLLAASLAIRGSRGGA